MSDSQRSEQMLLKLLFKDWAICSFINQAL
jgi:hypothetical protein